MNDIELWEQEISESNRYHVFSDLDNKINLLTESIVLDSKYSEYVGVSEGVLGTIKDKFIKAIQTIIKFFRDLKTKIIDFIKKIKNRKSKKHENMFAKEKEAIEKKYVEKIEKLEGEIKDLKKTIDTYKVESESDKKKYESLQQDMKDYKEQQEEAKDKLKAAIDNLDNKIKKREKEVINKINQMLKEKDVYIPVERAASATLQRIELSIDRIEDAISNNNKDSLDKCYIKRFIDEDNLSTSEAIEDELKYIFTSSKKLTAYDHYSTYVDFLNKEEETMNAVNDVLGKINSQLEKFTKNTNNDVDNEIYSASIKLLNVYKGIITEIIKRNLESYPAISKAKEMMEIAGMTGDRQFDLKNQDKIKDLKKL